MRIKSSTLRIFDISWFITLFAIYTSPIYTPKIIEHPTGSSIIPCLIGITMIFSKYLKDASVIGNILYWISINIAKPRTRYNHLIWGSFLLLCGLFSGVLGYLRVPSESKYFKELQGSYEYWICIIGVLLFNILVGYYTAKKHEKNEI